MLKNELIRSKGTSVQRQRLKSLFEEELLIIFQKLAKSSLPNSEYLLPVSFTKLDVSERFSKIKVYLDVEGLQIAQVEKILNLLNQDYLSLIKKKLGETKKFRSIPEVFFLEDKFLTETRKIEKIADKIAIEQE